MAVRGPWSSEEMLILRKMARTHTQAEVAAALQRTLRSVHGKANAMGVRFRKHGAAHHHAKHGAAAIRRIWELRNAGVDTRSIAAQTGIPRRTVRAVAGYDRRFREVMALDRRGGG